MQVELRQHLWEGAMRVIMCSSCVTLATEPSTADMRVTIDCVIELRVLRLSTELVAEPVAAGEVQGTGLVFAPVTS